MRQLLWSCRRKIAEHPAWLITSVWLLLVVCSCVLSGIQERRIAFDLATATARAGYETDMLMRHWASLHGGVYVEPSSSSQPNPYLEFLPDRDVITTDGKHLTLINPTYMMRQVYAVAGNAGTDTVGSRVVSLNPLSPENSPDDWERRSLRDFLAGKQDEVRSLATIGERRYLRLIRPIVTDHSCLKCHHHQDEPVGAIAGGVSVSLPYKPYEDMFVRQLTTHTVSHLLFGLLGVWIIGFFDRVIRGTRQRLRESEGRYRQMFDDSRAVKLMIDTATDRIVTANHAAARFYGYGLNELSAMTFSELRSSVDTVRHGGGKLAFRTTGPVFESHRRADRQLCPVEIYASPLSGEDGELFYVIIHDISARRKAEQALRTSEQKFSLAFQASPDAVNINRLRDGLYLEVNQGFTELTGYTRDDVIGRSSLDINIWADPEDRQRIVSAISEPSLRQSCDNIEAQFRRKDGSLTTALMSARLIELEGETAILSITRDISDIRKAERDVATQKHLFETMFNTIEDAIVITDTNLRISLANRAMGTIFGCRQEDVVGAVLADFCGNCDSFAGGPAAENGDAEQAEIQKNTAPNLLQTSVQRCICPGAPLSGEEDITCLGKGHLGTTGTTPQHFQGWYRRCDNSLFLGESFSAALHDSQNNWIGSLLIIRDISERCREEEERNRLRSQLQQAQKLEAIGTLAGGIAHDFNNILAAILGYAEMAREDSEPDSLAAGELDQVISAGHRAKELVEQILAFSRRGEDRRVRCNPLPVVRETLKLLRASLPATIRIEQQFTSLPVEILADPTELHQILMNLVTNAFHAMEGSGGVLTVAMDLVDVGSEEGLAEAGLAGGRYLRLSVADTGAGISAEHQNRIFDPYFTTKAAGKGTGLGLAIVHGFMKSYGGHIRCSSEPGIGTSFILYFPAMDEVGAVEQPAFVARPLPGGGESVLLVDDEQTLADMGASMLGRIGYRVTSMSSSWAAFKTFVLNPESFDLVITDQTMPEMTGLELAGRMLQVRPDLPIILCSGFSSSVSPELARQAGVKAFVSKPVHREELIRLVRELLDGVSQPT